MKNTTRQDAYSRIIQAKLGCLVNADEEYLFALRGFLFSWIDEIDAHVDAQVRARMAKEPENEDGEEWFDTVPIPERMKAS